MCIPIASARPEIRADRIPGDRSFSFENVTAMQCPRLLARPYAIPALNLFVACAFVSFGFKRASAASPLVQLQDSWRAEAPMHYARAAHAVVGDGKSIYALAGTGAGD